MNVPKKERILALRITEGSYLEDDEMTMITKDFKKYLRKGNDSSRSESYNKSKAPEKQTNDGSTRAMVATWKESSDDNDEDEQELMVIGKSDEETEEHDDEAIGLGNLTGGTEQRGTDPQTSREPVYEPVPQQQNIEGTSRRNQLVFRKKLDEDGTVTRNKERLAVQGYSHEEGIDYDETFALVARLEAIRLRIVFAAYIEFTLHQMDVKSAFLSGYLKEEVFVKQPSGFESKECLNHVYKLDKALYGLKQPRS
uniref:Uncharacterized protein LOC104218715 n=1 Tax=Nicotiana sylvestris TaxID=4096 RepID=A0A1U7VRJ7_NICSY|nr:PREDICTED: uncharacterized protein LOC104218715 [Nicotiana sylvestris]